MNKVIKIILISLGIFVLVLGIYIVVDCIRLKNAKFDTRPLITLNEEVKDYKTNTDNSYIKYTGIGYTIKYRYYYDKLSTDAVILRNGYGAEFKLLDKILIWAWIE